MLVARHLVFLGFADLLDSVDSEGTEFRLSFPKNKWGLFSNDDGTALYALPLDTEKQADIPKGRKGGKKLHRTWSAFDVDAAFKLSIPDAAVELHKIGTGLRIYYTSDKWTGAAQKYVHDFTSGPVCYADRIKKTPRAVGILCVNGKRLVTARGIVG